MHSYEVKHVAVTTLVCTFTSCALSLYVPTSSKAFLVKLGKSMLNMIWRPNSLVFSPCQDDELKGLTGIHVACPSQNVERMRATNKHRTHNYSTVLDPQIYTSSFTLGRYPPLQPLTTCGTGRRGAGSPVKRNCARLAMLRGMTLLRSIALRLVLSECSFCAPSAALPRGPDGMEMLA